jgi:hypothetical protein
MRGASAPELVRCLVASIPFMLRRRLRDPADHAAVPPGHQRVYVDQRLLPDGAVGWFAVLCGWTALALCLAAVLLHRRDA